MMILSFAAQFLLLLLDLLTARCRTGQAKDLEIALLRQQLRLLQRQQTQPVRLRRADRLRLAVLAKQLSTLARAVRHPWYASCLLISTVSDRVAGGLLAKHRCGRREQHRPHRCFKALSARSIECCASVGPQVVQTAVDPLAIGATHLTGILIP
jgi:hypothetical protein